MSKERPLHPGGDQRVFQHPIKGCVWAVTNADYVAYAKDVGEGSSEDDLGFRKRLQLGDWLVDRMPDPKHRITHQLFIDAIFKPPFGEDSQEGQQLLERVDMAQSVMDAGGACTSCGVEPLDEFVDHRVGCEYVSFQLWALTQEAEKAINEPSLDQVVRDAQAQIERMR
jgi:hypothetical protein